jgi:threonine dehydrogenase-like Zn-dependent dehydrogenase
MKALRFEDIGRLDLVDVEPPRIAPGQLLVRTGAATICTSDLHDLAANPFGIDLPVILGHEGAGTVVEVGADVTGFRVGDRIAAHPVHPCGTCPTCKAGMDHLCTAMGHFGLNLPGTFADHFAVRADRARVIPDDVEFAVAALTEPVCVSLEAVRQANCPPGGSLLVIGDGPFGVLMARLAARGDTGQVVIAGHHDSRLAFAPGALPVNLRNVTDPAAALRVASGGAGFDAAILAVGSAGAFRIGLHSLRPKGRLVIFAPLPGETPVDLFTVLLRELEIVGSVNDPNLMDEAIEALADPELAPGDLVTHRFRIEDYREAFALAASRQGGAMKIAFTFDDAEATV